MKQIICIATAAIAGCLALRRLQRRMTRRIAHIIADAYADAVENGTVLSISIRNVPFERGKSPAGREGD